MFVVDGCGYYYMCSAFNHVMKRVGLHTQVRCMGGADCWGVQEITGAAYSVVPYVERLREQDQLHTDTGMALVMEFKQM